MSIIASVKVYDGLAVSADSMTQIFGVEQTSGQKGIVKQYHYAKKLFQLADLPIAVATYGIGNLGSRSIESLLLEFSGSPLPSNSVEAIADKMFRFFKDKYNSIFGKHPSGERPHLGFYVGGYSQDSPYAEDWEFIFPDFEEIKLVRPKEHFGASWRGIFIPFTRLYRGIDPRLEYLLKQEGVTDETIKKAHSAVESPIIFDGMPIQDAIDLAKFIVDTTIHLARFEAGPQTCGGPVDVAVILPEKGFSWIQQKSLGITL